MFKPASLVLSLLLLSDLPLGQTKSVAGSQEPLELNYRNLVISGQVVDENGQPVAKAQVEARPNSLSGPLPHAFSDDQGKFSISVRKPGPFKLTASKYSDNYGPTASPFYYPATESLPEVIVSNERLAPFTTVRLGPRQGKILFNVVDKNTRLPIQHVTIVACRAETPRFCRRQSLSSPTGKFQMLVPAVQIVLQVSAEGHKDWVSAEGDEPSHWLVDSNTATEVNVRLKPGKPDEASGPEEGVKLEGAWKLQAPRLLSPISGTIFYNFPRQTRLEWSVVPGAKTYTVEIDFCDFRSQDECKNPSSLEANWMPPMTGIEGTSYEFNFLGAQPGRWRVWATDERGRAGVKSEWSIFFYRR